MDAGDDGIVVHEAVGPSLSGREAAAIIVLGVIALNIVGLFAVLLGALNDEHRLSASGIGLTAMAELLSMGVVTGLCGAFVPATRLRAWGIGACVLLAALDLASIRVGGAGVIAMRAAAGAPEGVLLWITVGMIARTETPERWAGFYFTSQVVAQLALAAAYWAVVLPRFGSTGGFIVLSATTLIGVPVALLIPTAYGALKHAEGTSGGPPLRGWLALLATVVFVSANGAVGVYLQPLGHEAGLSANIVRLATFISLIAQVAGGAMATALAGKVHYLTVFVIGAIAFLIVWTVFGLGHSAPLFVAANALAGMSGLLIGPFLVPMTIEADPTRRAAMQSGGAQLVGGAAGPLLASMVVGEKNVHGVLWLGAGLLLAGLAGMTAIRFTAKSAAPA